MRTSEGGLNLIFRHAFFDLVGLITPDGDVTEYHADHNRRTEAAGQRDDPAQHNDNDPAPPAPG